MVGGIIMNNENRIRKVLQFSTKVILQSLNGEKPSKAELDSVRKICEELGKDGVIEFDFNCSDVEMIEKIHEISTHINPQLISNLKATTR